jgi:hypothetical protein
MDDPDDLERKQLRARQLAKKWLARRLAKHRARRHRFAEHMEVCQRAWDAGVTLAVADAVEWCQRYGRPPEPWLVEAVVTLAGNSVTPTEADRHRYDQGHYERYDAVMELLEREPDLPLEQAFPRVAKMLNDVEKRNAQNAAALSRKTVKPKKVKPKTVGDSFYRVQREVNEGRGGRYFIPTNRRENF